MGKAQDKVEELTRQIEELSKDRELAIREAKKEKSEELENEKSKLEAEVNELDLEWKKIKETLDGKDRRFNVQKGRLVEIEAELKSLRNKL